METFCKEGGGGEALRYRDSVARRDPRFRALRLAALCVLLIGGGGSALLAANPPVRATTTTETTGATTTSAAHSVVVFTGHGWGHGLGMSQWGAYGYAKHGWTFDRILAHYYSGTTLGPAPLASVRVLLVEGAKKVTFTSSVPWRVVDGTATKKLLPAGALALTPQLAVAGERLQAPLTFVSGPSAVSLADKPYRGRFVVTVAKGKLQVVNVVGLEAYLKGVVPAEMPSAWSPEALKAQAVAARSYALANVAKGRDYDLYADTRSQVYGGVKAEAATASTAVDATEGQVVLAAGKVASTYFFSTSGGRTASALESTGRAVPYLVSVADPYDTASPYHDWGPVLADAASVARQLKVPGSLVDLQTTAGPSGRVRSVVAVGSTGPVTVTGTALRADLDLRSTWFTAGFLALTPPKLPVTFGGAATLAGVARRVEGAGLESRVGSGPWVPAGAVVTAADGSFSTIVRPLLTTDYRIVAGAVHAALARVPVAPLVRATIAQGSATGTIRPAIENVPVQLQVQDATDGPWRTIATARTDASAAFALAGDGSPGALRVRAAPGNGLVPGFSASACC